MFHNEPLNILPAKFNPVPIAAAEAFKILRKSEGRCSGSQ